MMKKKLLLYANYFYPEFASTGQLLTEMCEGLVDDFDITVICSVPCYTGVIEDKYKGKKFYYEEYKGIKIIRVPVPEFQKSNKLSRIKHILAYYFNSLKITRKIGKQDIVMTISQPPVLGGLLGLYGKKKTKGKLVYLIEDFNPEQIMAVSYSKNKLILKLMMYLDKKTCKKSDLIITVGSDMQETLSNRFNGKAPNNVVINNWIDEKNIYPLSKDNNGVSSFLEQYDLKDRFIIMYSGNLGLYYDLENIMRIIKDYKENDSVRFVFIGEGSVKGKLQEYVSINKMSNVVFIPYQDKEKLIYSLNSADVHLVTNAKGIKGVSVPSKIYGCLATNIPILGILEEGSEAYRIINDSKCGIVAETSDYESIKKAFDSIINNREEFIINHKTGREYLLNNFTKELSIQKYREELNKIVK